MREEEEDFPDRRTKQQFEDWFNETGPELSEESNGKFHLILTRQLRRDIEELISAEPVVGHRFLSKFSIQKAAPGKTISAFTSFVFGKKLQQRVFDQIRNDMLVEYCEALQAGRPRLAKWVRIRGSADMMLHAVLQIGVGLVDKIVKAWKGFSV